MRTRELNLGANCYNFAVNLYRRIHFFRLKLERFISETPKLYILKLLSAWIII